MFHPTVLACLVAAAAAAPATYDQRQDGDFNVRADVQNLVLVVAYPQRMKLPIGDLFAGLESNKPESEFQDRADVRVTEAFVEPSEPYRVEIGTEGKNYGVGDGRNVEVVIAGRRRLERGPPAEAEGEKEEYKLLGAREQCGPGRERDPDTLTCRPRAQADPAPAQSDRRPEEPTDTALPPAAS